MLPPNITKLFITRFPTELFAHAPTRQQQPASSQRQSAAPSMQAARDQAAAGTEEKGEVEPAGGGLKPDKSGICTQVLGSHPPC